MRASAHNVNGWSILSSINTSGVTVKTQPTTMTAPIRDAGTSSSKIVVDWTAITVSADTGDSAILSYNLEWDAGSVGSTWVDLIGYSTNSIATSFTINSGIIAGNPYQFRLRAKNIYGFGPFSTTTSI